MNHLKELIKHYIREIISEAPIGDYNLVGDWNKTGSFHKAVDRRLIPNSRAIEKVRQKWSRTDYDFDMTFVNKPGLRKYMFEGEVSEEFVREKLKLITPEEFKVNEDAINLIYVTNTDNVMLTAWMMAHRLSHTISYFKTQQTNHAIRETIASLYSSLFSAYESVNMEKPKTYRSPWSSQSVHIMQPFDKPKLNFWSSILTMKSGREHKIANLNELIHELFAQYIINGKIKFNRPDFIYGKRKIKIFLNQEKREELHNKLDILENELSYYFDNILSSMVGNIYII
jgi:hypothetical protein